MENTTKQFKNLKRNTMNVLFVKKARILWLRQTLTITPVNLVLN